MEMLWNLCEEIKGSNTFFEEINSLAKSILEKKDVIKSLEEINTLSYLLYVQNKFDISLSICEVLKKNAFDGNYDVWSWIESSLALGARILREKGDVGNYQDYIEKIKNTLEIGSEIEQKIKGKAFVRRLKGMLLYDDKINIWKERNDMDMELGFRISQMKELCFIYEMGGSEEFTKEIVNEKFIDNLEEIKKILSSS